MAGHIRQRSPGSFELRYPATIAGNRQVKTVTFRGGKREAERELRRLMSAAERGEHATAPKSLTLAGYLSDWLAAIQERTATRTADSYARIVNTYLSDLGSIPLTKLSSADLDRAFTAWSKDGRRDGKPGGLSIAARRFNFIVLNIALQRALRIKLISRNPCDDYRSELPKARYASPKPIVTLSPAQTMQIQEAARTSPGSLYIPITIAIGTGARRGEILAIRWRSVDLDKGMLMIAESTEQMKGSIRSKRPKGEKIRNLDLPIFVIDELRAHKRQQAETLLSIGIRQTPDTLVCCRDDGTTQTPWTLTTAFGRLVRSMPADFPRIGFHGLRHTHATQLIEQGLNPREVQERLGHHDVAFTLRTYVHVTDAMRRDAAKKIDNLLGGRVKG